MMPFTEACCELRRIPLPRTPVNKPLSPWVAITSAGKGGHAHERASPQDKPQGHPREWAEGLYYNSGMFSEILVYHDDESIYIEHRGKESGVVRFTFEMIEGLKIVEEQEGE